MSYNRVMSPTFTLRIDSEMRRKLKHQAAALEKTESEFVRDLLERELEPTPLGVRLQRVKGILALDKVDSSGWRRELRRRNWRR